MTADLDLADLYHTDFYGWTQTQAQLLRQGQLAPLDRIHLAEEIEALGKQERRELENRLKILIGHLLKWDYQPSHRSKSWKATIREQRRSIAKLMAQNPSLKPYLTEAIEDGFQSGLDLVVQETPLDYAELPTACPYTPQQLFDPQFPPGLDAPAHPT